MSGLWIDNDISGGETELCSRSPTTDESPYTVGLHFFPDILLLLPTFTTFIII